MDEQTYVITFDDASAAEANRYAGELRQALLDASPEVVVHRQRDDPGTQDFGATLLLLLGTPAAGAIVKAIGDWLALRHRASLTIKRADGEIVVRTITSARAAELIGNDPGDLTDSGLWPSDHAGVVATVRI